MGVHGLYTYIRRFYSSCFTSPPPFDLIAIDGNQFIFSILYITQNPVEIATFFLSIVNNYGKYYNCKCLIFMDGTSHVAKRSRKSSIFDKHFYSTQKENVALPSPLLWKQISDTIDDIISQYENISYYSSCKDSGEGEHKILQHLRNLGKDSTIHRNVGIISKDSDLLLLGMTLTESEGWNFSPYIIRHIQHQHCSLYDPHYIIDCSLLREQIIDSYNITGRKSIWNFILALFILGNDYLPRIPEMRNLNLMFPILRNAPLDLYNGPESNEPINWKGYSTLLTFVAQQIRRKSSLVYKDCILFNSEDNLRKLSIEEFESLFYFYLPYVPKKDTFVSNWLTTIEWLFHYYFYGIDYASITWQYPYEYSPPLNTLLESRLI